MTWGHEEALAWLYGRQALGIKLGLEKVHRMLHLLGDPQEHFHAVHIAGTNGKGTVAALLAEALRRAGHRTGLTTSPHLVHFHERIRIDGEPVPDEQIAAGLARVRDAVAELDATGEPPTFFEAVTALAFLLFAQRGVQWAVVETGLGGRLDATNVLRPDLTVITNVERDHEEMLGGSLDRIAYEKAGIMKPGVPCVTGARDAPLVVLKGVSHDLHAPMSILGEDYHAVPDVNGLRLVTPSGEAHYDLAVAGEHQIDNAALVVAACDALRQQGVHVPPAAVSLALAQTTMPGRMESFHPTAGELGAPPGPAAEQRLEVLLDGAHNETAAHALRRHLTHREWAGFHLIVGVNRDKDWQAMLAQWVPLAAQVWGVPLRNPRSLRPEEMKGFVADHGIPFATASSVAEALAAAASAGAPRILVAGSLFLVGEARAVLTGQGLEEIHGAQ